MDITTIHKPISKSQAAQTLGLHTFDTALPQPWLDYFVSKVKDEGAYEKAVSNLVWAYDRSPVGGLPYPLTLQGYEVLRAIDEAAGTSFSIEQKGQTFRVLDICL
jgi:hypothetical protein